MQAAWWVLRPVSFLERHAARFGAQFSVRFPRYPPIVFTAEPETIRDVFAADADTLHAGRGNRILAPLLGEGSLLLLDGERHRRERRRVLPVLRGERMRAYAAAMAAVADETIERWPVGRAFAVLPEMQRLTLDIILRTVFGIDDPGRLALFRERVGRLLAFGAHPALLMMVRRDGGVIAERLQRGLGGAAPWGRFVRLRERVRDLLAEEFARRRGGGSAGGEDVLSLLAAARDEDGRPLDDTELGDQLMTLLVAGHETTATALAWSIERLLCQPEVRERACAEVAGEGDVPEAARLRYLDAVVRETLRLSPVIPIVVRHVARPCRLGSLALERGAVVAPVAWLAQRHPAAWPEPERFEPQRFLEGGVRPWAWFPFGGGSRTCVGMAFAMEEIKVVLARVLARTELELAPGYVARVVRRSVTFAPSRGVPVVRRR